MQDARSMHTNSGPHRLLHSLSAGAQRKQKKHVFTILQKLWIKNKTRPPSPNQFSGENNGCIFL